MCTRIYNNNEGTIFTTGRSMDWRQQLDTSMYVFPKGTRKSGLPGEDGSNPLPVRWTSKYASAVTMVGDMASSDGINSEGLVANVLYQSTCEYAPILEDEKRAGLSVLRWVQYVLDNFKTAEEVRNAFEDNKTMVIVPAKVPEPGGEPKDADLHLSVSDREGGSVIIEINDGRYDVSYSPTYRVMTNDPKFHKQLELNQYWEWQWDRVNNTHPSDTLPGSPFSPDRFAKASYYINHLENAKTEQEAVAQMFSVIMNASVPMGYVLSPDEPNISQTLWSTVGSHQSRCYYFRDVLTPNVFWTNLEKQDELPPIGEGNDCWILRLKEGEEFLYHAGCVNKDYQPGQDPFAIDL